MPLQSAEPDPDLEARWAAWVARGRLHDLAVRRKLRLALIVGVVVAGVAAVLFRLLGGTL